MLEKIYKKIEEFDTIVIARHIGVDPDALASQLALRDSIKLTFPNKKGFLGYVHYNQTALFHIV